MPVAGTADLGPGTDSRADGRPRLAVPAGELLPGVCLVLFLNGIARIVADVSAKEGILPALGMTFNISVIVWVSLAVAAGYLARDRTRPATAGELRAACAAGACALVPFEPLSWIGLTALSAYLIRTTPAGSHANRGAWIMAALCVPMFWSKLVFYGLIDEILKGDAVLASWMLGTARDGNTVQFADGSGFLWIAPTCSSLANVSLAALCWMTFMRVRDARLTWASGLACLLACLSVVAVNVVRIAAIGTFPAYYDLLHYGLGATVASTVSLLAILAICSVGVRRGARG